MKLRISGDKLTIACAHMLSKHDKCARVHGHNYQIEVEIEGELNENNMIIDFSLFKESVGEILKELDHKTLLPENSKDFDIKTNEKEVVVTTCDDKRYRFPREDVILLPIEATTAELMSIYFHNLIKKQFPGFKVTVIMSETPTSKVIYTDD
ncbi:MAG: 6-carboxytetrahydropterin synthase [Candidatus Heimdallarchaeota archaeon]|nr:6-carboxytetrahydropterin synthase [Candidatus Heimdallarchaeota archaeon]